MSIILDNKFATIHFIVLLLLHFLLTDIIIIIIIYGLSGITCQEENGGIILVGCKNSRFKSCPNE